jgi:hypothetical protein
MGQMGMAEAKRRFSSEKKALEPQGADLRYIFPLPFPERRLVLMALDLLAVNGALLLALALRPGYGLDGGLVLRHPLFPSPEPALAAHRPHL